MKLILSFSSSLCKWLKEDIPRIPTESKQHVGRVELPWGEDTISWQFHVHRLKKLRQDVVIATHAFSRYTLFIPVDFEPHIANIEMEFLRRWGSEVAMLALENGLFEDADLDLFTHQFSDEIHEVFIGRNTDLSVNGHISDAISWLEEYVDSVAPAKMDDEHAFTIGFHVNEKLKRFSVKNAQGKKVKGEMFVPITRLLDDAMFHFGKGLAPYEISPDNDFPSPYFEGTLSGASKADLKKPENTAPPPDNVVYLDSYRNKD